MLSIETTRDNVCESLFNLLEQAASGVMKHHKRDLYFFDHSFLEKQNKIKNLIKQQVEDEERVFWSVGSHGTHIGIMKHASQRVWTNIFPNYNHYEVWFSITVDDVITANLIPIAPTE